MKAAMIFVAVLGLNWPLSTAAGHPPSGYSTLVIQFVGEMDRPIFPMVISTSMNEGEWYRQNLIEDVIRGFNNVYVVPN